MTFYVRILDSQNPPHRIIFLYSVQCSFSNVFISLCLIIHFCTCSVEIWVCVYKCLLVELPRLHKDKCVQLSQNSACLPALYICICFFFMVVDPDPFIVVTDPGWDFLDPGYTNTNAFNYLKIQSACLRSISVFVFSAWLWIRIRLS